MIGDLRVGAMVNCMTVNGTALALSGALTLTDGATLRLPDTLTLAEQTDTKAGVGAQVLMNGDAADTMVVATPSTPVTRGVAVYNLWKLKGSPTPEGEYPFADQPAQDFLRDAIHWAGATGLSKGCGDGQFHDMDSITNEQFAVLFYRVIGSPAVEGDYAEGYLYAATVSPWAREAMVRASKGWPMDPQVPLTHGEMDRLVVLLSRMG